MWKLKRRMGWWRLASPLAGCQIARRQHHSTLRASSKEGPSGKAVSDTFMAAPGGLQDLRSPSKD